MRARPLLQLHKLSEAGKRPEPAFDILPSAILSPKLSKAIAKAYGTKHGLCSTDVAIVRADKYHEHGDNEEKVEVLALLCKGRKNDSENKLKAKICLDDGTEWEACTLPNGGYEFFTTDTHGLGTTVRWIPKRVRSKSSNRVNTMASLTETPNDETCNPEQKKFNFSTITPNSRRHPIISSLTRTNLDISNEYFMPCSTSTQSQSHSQPMSRTSSAEAAGVTTPNRTNSTPTAPTTAEEAIPTTPQLRTLITATGIYVALREGWCPSFRYSTSTFTATSESDTLSPSLPRSPSLHASAALVSPAKSTFSAPAAPADGTADLGLPRRSTSLRQLLRSASGLGRGDRERRRRESVDRNARAPMPAIAVSDAGAEGIGMANGGSGRRRAESASTVLIHRPGSRQGPTRLPAGGNGNGNGGRGTTRSKSRPELRRGVTDTPSRPSTKGSATGLAMGRVQSHSGFAAVRDGGDEDGEDEDGDEDGEDEDGDEDEGSEGEGEDEEAGPTRGGNTEAASALPAPLLPTPPTDIRDGGMKGLTGAGFDGPASVSSVDEMGGKEGVRLEVRRKKGKGMKILLCGLV